MEYAFRGFDIAWYFINALVNFGENFENCLPYYSPWHTQSKMDFKKVDEKNGFENQFWKVLRYNKFYLEEVETHPPVDSLPIK
jgi:hypothetical protein